MTIEDSDKPAEPGAEKLPQQHVSHLLDDVLKDTEESAPTNLRYPIILDVLLGLGLLVAVGGFTVGLFNMYIVHSAAQAVSTQQYGAAISMLQSAPLPQVFSRPGSDTEELLSKARYLDAMDKIERGGNKEEAIRELSAINTRSKYFNLAQEVINENTEPSPVLLQVGAEHNVSPEQANENKNAEKPTILEKTIKESE